MTWKETTTRPDIRPQLGTNLVQIDRWVLSSANKALTKAWILQTCAIEWKSTLSTLVSDQVKETWADVTIVGAQAIMTTLNGCQPHLMLQIKERSKVRDGHVKSTTIMMEKAWG